MYIIILLNYSYLIILLLLLLSRWIMQVEGCTKVHWIPVWMTLINLWQPTWRRHLGYLSCVYHIWKRLKVNSYTVDFGSLTGRITNGYFTLFYKNQSDIASVDCYSILCFGRYLNADSRFLKDFSKLCTRITYTRL